MKQINALAVLILFLAGRPFASIAQDTLPVVTVVSRNYKYLRSVDNQESSQPVRLLERQAAAFDIKNLDIYSEDYDTYYISFYLPQGYILAAYDAQGKLLSTAERFKNVALPAVVKNAVLKKYPGWAILEDTYRVNYQEDSKPKIMYKITIASRDKRLRVKVGENGDFN